MVGLRTDFLINLFSPSPSFIRFLLSEKGVQEIQGVFLRTDVVMTGERTSKMLATIYCKSVEAHMAVAELLVEFLCRVANVKAK
jgi:hypothetical protein